jgi:chemotaxis protein methyltransferase CheR
MKRTPMPEQHEPLPQPLLASLSAFLAENIGVHFTSDRHADLERGMRAAARSVGHANVEMYVRQLLCSPLTREQIETLASHLTIGETYFFREKESLAALETHILPPLIRARAAAEPRLRIWSAGCSTGEEPYSIAITLARAIPDFTRWNISILATDINPAALRKAFAGVYGEWSFRNTPPHLKDAFFRKTRDGRRQVAARIRSLVKFDYLNLATDCYPSVENGTNAMDIVFCRNVLIYFEAARAKSVLHKLSLSLLEGGWLFLNPVEIPHFALPQLAAVNFIDAIVHRKNSSRAGGEIEAVRSNPAAAPVERPALANDLHDVPLPPEQAARTRRPRLASAPAGEKSASPANAAYEGAVRLYEQGRYGDAVRELDRRVSQSPGDVRAMGLLARAHANQGQLDEAVRWCEKAIAADKLNAGWRYLLATILQEQGLIDEATAALRKALYLDGNNALAHYALGNLIRRRGRHREAERHFRNALAILSACAPEQVLPESEGITAGRLAEIIRSTVVSELRV